MLATTPSGSCVICSRTCASASTVSGASALFACARKKSIRPASALSSLRAWPTGLPVSRVRIWASSLFLFSVCPLNFSIAPRRSARRTAAHAGCAARARSYFAATARASSSASSRTREPSDGLRIFTRCLEEFVEQRRGVQRAMVAAVQELRMPLHAGDVVRPLVADGFDHAILGRVRLDREALAQAVHRLVMDRIHFRVPHAGIERREPRIRHDLDLVVLVLVDRRVLVDLRARLLRRGVL